MSSFKNRVVLVTGSGRGIGREIALQFAREGADIVVNFFRNRDPAEETASDIRALGQKAVVVKANVGNQNQLEFLFQEVDRHYGGLDILIHNAASGYNRPSLEQKERGWDWTMNINARSLLFGAQHASRLMEKRGGGSIVAISSLGSKYVLPDYVAVGASKAALEAVVRYLAVELADSNIIVNAVSPGLTLTDALAHFAIYDEAGKELIDRVKSKTPASRLCQPNDVAEVVTFLCSSSAQMIRGQIITMDGGYSLQMNI